MMIIFQKTFVAGKGIFLYLCWQCHPKQNPAQAIEKEIAPVIKIIYIRVSLMTAGSVQMAKRALVSLMLALADG